MSQVHNFSQIAQDPSRPLADATIIQADQEVNCTMASEMNIGNHSPTSEDGRRPYSIDTSSSGSGSDSPGTQAMIGDIDLNGASAGILLESGFIQIDVRVVTATHTAESPSYGPCSATVVVPLDIRYVDLKQTCSHAIKRASSDRQWCKRWTRPKDEIISLLNINCWDCSEKLQEMSRAPRPARDCIEIFISGIVSWDATADDHFSRQYALDAHSASLGQGRVILWHATYLPSRLPMELQPNGVMLRYEDDPCALCWYWVEVNVQDGIIV